MLALLQKKGLLPAEAVAEFCEPGAGENPRGSLFLPDEKRPGCNRERDGVAAGIQFVQRGQRPARAIQIRAEPDPDKNG